MNDKMLGGVLGGFAEYMDIDVTIVRLGYILLTLIACVPFIVFYLIAWFIIPKNPTHIKHDHKKSHEEEVKPESEVTE